MTDPTIQNTETALAGLRTKAWAWLKAHWYAFGIGAVAGGLVGHVLWK